MHPVFVTATVALAGFVLVALLALALGAVVTHLVVGHTLGHGDADVARWLAQRRTQTGNDLSLVGSYFAETATVVVIAGVAVLVLAWRRLWPQCSMLVVSMLVEAGVYLTATYFVDRSRPGVPRLEDLIKSDSFPSGHTAAAVALYGSLTVIVWSLTQRTLWRALVLGVFVVVPFIVAASRLYRGMHNVTDVVCGALLGGCCIAVGFVATRSGMQTAHDRRAPCPAEGCRALDKLEEAVR